MKKLFFIACHTGCSCCSDDNHTRGPYFSEEDAQRRIDRFISGKDYPLASQYAKHGRYRLISKDAEEISGDRWIIDDMVFPASITLMTNSEGIICSGHDDLFTNEDWWY